MSYARSGIIKEDNDITQNERRIYMTVKEKEKELLHLSDDELIKRILAFPDREYLNRDEDGKRRKYPSAEMAIGARRNMERNSEWKISDKQRWAMAHSFAEYSSNQLKVSGITFAKADPNDLEKTQISKEGVKSVYSMEFYLIPEPENEHDRNAVAVYAHDENGGDNIAYGEWTYHSLTKVGYVPAAYTSTHPISMPMKVEGTLTDHSNGHFKTISYTMDMDTEAIDREFTANNRDDMYTYRMPFILNGDAKDGIEEYMNGKRWTDPDGTKGGWASRINNELESYGVNGYIDDVRFEFPGGKAGCIVVESSLKLNDDAMQLCGSYFRYCLEYGISTDLKREELVDAPWNQPAVNMRDHLYFSLQSEPTETNENDFSQAVADIPADDADQSL